MAIGKRSEWILMDVRQGSRYRTSVRHFNAFVVRIYSLNVIFQDT